MQRSVNQLQGIIIQICHRHSWFRESRFRPVDRFVGCIELHSILSRMSSYIIAGSADSLDTAYCEQIARRIKAKYKNIDFRVVIKHPSEWEDYLQEICRIYGFPNKFNPIIYTYHGKIIGNKDAFIENATKYFGLSHEILLVPKTSNAVNQKLAEQELQAKNIMKKGIRTLQEKIDLCYSKLLKQGLAKHRFIDNQEFLVNGIEFYFREVEGMCPNLKFPQHCLVTPQMQIVLPDKINLAELAKAEQIRSEDDQKQAFVTTNQPNNELIDKTSEASKTNRLHSSVLSRDGDSKMNKESNSEQQKIDEEFDDVADYSQISMADLSICEIADNFYLAFERPALTHLPAEMVLYYNEEEGDKANVIRNYNDGRAVIGHRTLIKEIHYIDEDVEKEEDIKNLGAEGQDEAQGSEQGSGQEQVQASIQDQGEKEMNEQPVRIVNEQVNEQPMKEAEKQEQAKEGEEKEGVEKQIVERTTGGQPALIPERNEVSSEPQKGMEDVFKACEDNAVKSEPHSELNIISNLNYHTLYILKPLSQNQLRYSLYVAQETNNVICLQFPPENPNPKIKVYDRKHLLRHDDSLFPTEHFIDKQKEDDEWEEVELPRDDSSECIKFLRINDIGFTHLLYEYEEDVNDQVLAKVIKLGVGELLNLEESLKKEIGYNLVITKKYLLLVALTEPYKVYGSNSLYFDGLAYLGYVCVAKVVESYQMKKKPIDSGESIREALMKCSGGRLDNDQ